MTVAAAPPVTPMRRVAGACLVGSAIEFYDFLIYGTAAALVFPTVFFPHLSPAMGTIASMGTFASAFVSRPIGGAAFGYFGDRLGRKRTLIATLVLMAVATVSVGLVPRTESIGIAAPLILVALRLVQGFAAGGEWAGSVLLSAEYAPADKRGRYGMFTLLGGGTAAVLSSLTFLGVNVTIGENSPAFLAWGWRIPFLISAVLIAIALYVRLRIDETPVFVAEKARNPTRASLSRSCCACSAARSCWPAAASWAGCLSSTWRTPISLGTRTPNWATLAASSGPSGRWAGWSASRSWHCRRRCVTDSGDVG